MSDLDFLWNFICNVGEVRAEILFNFVSVVFLTQFENFNCVTP